MAPLINISKSNTLIPFIHYFNDKGIEWKSAAASHQLPDDIVDAEHWLASHQVMGFLNTMMQSSKQRIGLDVGRLVSIGQLFPELEAQLTQYAKLDDALHLVMGFAHQLSNHIVIWPEKINTRWYLCHRGAYHPNLSGYDQAEWFRSFILLSFCRYFLGQKWQPKHVFMSFSAHLGENLPDAFRETQFTFGHAFGAIEIPLSADFVALTVEKKNDHWDKSINALIETYASLPWFNVKWLADFANSSPRTLQRHLRGQGQSFRERRDRARCRKAQKLLESGHSLPYQVAWQCGYNDLSNFNRAFKSWTGKTPAQYQKNL